MIPYTSERTEVQEGERWPFVVVARAVGCPDRAGWEWAVHAIQHRTRKSLPNPLR
jgi:hypothetical protein